MPKKRNTSWSRNKKEKQILTARLIEISLKVEDYIYKHKLISVREAEQYIREVTSYKIKCSRDQRSLQVIEKLTRCMRAIILDHQELRTENHTINNGSSIPGGIVNAGSISPVYSIPDEDRIQFTQIAERATNNIEIIDLSNIDDDDDSIHNGTNTATPDYAGSKISVEVDIHRCMSILSLKDAGERLDMGMSAEANCSQSILNNFEGVEQMLQNEINMTSQRTFASGLVGNVSSKGKTINVMQSISSNGKGTDKILNKNINSIEPNKNVKTAIAPNRPIFKCNTKNNWKVNTIVSNKEPLKVTNATSNISSQIFCPATNNIPEGQRQTCYDSNSTCRINDSNLGLKDAKHFTVVQPIRQVHNDVNQDTVKNAFNLNVVDIPTNTLNAADKENQENAIVNHRTSQQNNRPISKTAVVQEKSITTKKKRGPTKKKLTNEKEIKPKNKKAYRRIPKSNEEYNKYNTFTETTKNKILPIYNENVVNDLSWIENIRYVREIKADENDPKLNLEESFWDNYYLPAGWSENEFL